MTADTATGAETRTRLNPAGRSFIEVQFPVSKLSKESYRERKSVAGQTLTALGKWWGRKPLVLVRAILLGLLLPATDNPDQDREVFLALMTMDDDGLVRRMNGALPLKIIYDLCVPRERTQYFIGDETRPAWNPIYGKDIRLNLQRQAFARMGYDRKLDFCVRPEEIDGPSEQTWNRINAHLGTHASTLPELVEQLGERRFGHIPRIGDAFSGGGSIPFEATRIGCVTYASDLNPVAALLTWGAINIVGGEQATSTKIKEAQRRVFRKAQGQIDEWAIERNAQGWVADAYLYCNEVLDPVTNWRIPLAPSWLIASKANVIARLNPDPVRLRFDIEIIENVSAEEALAASTDGTWDDGLRSPIDRVGHWVGSEQRQTISMEQLRGRQGLRVWGPNEVLPQSSDVFQERLYCVRWVDPETGTRYYRAPTEEDFERERKVARLLTERFEGWQSQGFIPSRRIQPGKDINRPTNARGWACWHQMFNPRQLLLNGLLSQYAAQEHGIERAAMLILIGRLANVNSRLSRWQVGQGGGIGGGKEVFFKPSLSSPFANYSCRPMRTLATAFGLRNRLNNGQVRARRRTMRRVMAT